MYNLKISVFPNLNVLLQGELNFANAPSKLLAAVFTNSKAPFLTVNLPHMQLVTENDTNSIDPNPDTFSIHSNPDKIILEKMANLYGV